MSPDPITATGGDVADYVALMKPRVMFLVVFTALVGLVAAPGTIELPTGDRLTTLPAARFAIDNRPRTSVTWPAAIGVGRGSRGKYVRWGSMPRAW